MSDNFPSPEAADPQDVTLALETGEALWSNDKHFEALRWLRRAADSSEQAGNDLRAVFLAKTAADLTTLAEQLAAAEPEAPPAPAEDAASPRSGPPPLPPSAMPPARPPEAELTAPDPFSEAPVPAAAAEAPKPAPVVAPAAPRPKPAAPSLAPSVKAEPAPPAAAPESSPAPLRSARKPSPIKVRGETVEVDVRQAVRVAVKRSARDESLYVVRQLDDGQAPALGSSEALLILLERE
jgi:hypothetical protein